MGKDNVMGECDCANFVRHTTSFFRVGIDLTKLALETTHNLWLDVENGEGKLNVLVTISGTTRWDIVKTNNNKNNN